MIPLEGKAQKPAERAQILAKAIDQLPDDERQVVWLRIREDLSFREIAELLNTPLGTILSRMHEARKRLRPTLKPHPEL